MKIFYSKQKETKLFISKGEFYALVSWILKKTELLDDKSRASISINFVSEKTISQINEDFVGHEGITDVISFRYDEDIKDLSSNDVFSEIFVCVEKALLESEKRKIEFARELTLYTLHGILHIAGFNDELPEEKKIMWRFQSRCMKEIKKQFKLNEIFLLKKPEKPVIK